MRILGVDTSTRTGSVALLDKDTVVAEIQVTSSETHAKRLMLAIDLILGMAGTLGQLCLPCEQELGGKLASNADLQR